MKRTAGRPLAAGLISKPVHALWSRSLWCGRRARDGAVSSALNDVRLFCSFGIESTLLVL
nr:hypothetical protein [Haematospirillum sp. H1815]